MKRSPKKIIIGILLVFALGLVYAGSTHRWFGYSAKSAIAVAGPNSEKKVLYWYDAMNPQHHYDKPGKAPDGLDLLPLYAEPETSPAGQASSTASADMSTMSGMSSERKPLYWYDPMHQHTNRTSPAQHLTAV